VVRRIDDTLGDVVEAGLGGAAIKKLLQEIDLDALQRQLRKEIEETQGPKRLRAIKRIEVVNAFVESKSRPEWMILDCVPVISPELRPMVQLDGGRFATSDLNDLYRRIINRNNRLKKITEIRAPESIVNHEKRLLQEAVDALIDNGRRTRPVTGSNGRRSSRSSTCSRARRAASARTCSASAWTTRAARSSWSARTCTCTSAACPRRWRWSCSSRS
jgi:DNA-directed RNA polymerase subunit beta'